MHVISKIRISCHFVAWAVYKRRLGSQFTKSHNRNIMTFDVSQTGLQCRVINVSVRQETYGHCGSAKVDRCAMRLLKVMGHSSHLSVNKICIFKGDCNIMRLVGGGGRRG